MSRIGSWGGWAHWPLPVLLAALAAWLWPIGPGGKMPVGGDVTSFSIGLMAVLQRAIQGGRLPLWNDLWGFGFPGVAESQMGVFYPPHLMLYGLLPTETAYTGSLVVHTVWGALGVYWASRRFGVSTIGAALGAFAWTTCGFFVIHLPHQWGYTTGAWMPWALGLAYPLAVGKANRRNLLALAAVLAIQTLPGHFQLAFTTQVGVLVLGLWGLVERLEGRRKGVQGMASVLLALAIAALLAAAQLGPTFRLASLADTRRDYEYLSGFAVAPLHLVSFVAPGLFHHSPLWRPLAWDPWHTSPEEHLGYLGLVPLFLALGAIRHGWRRDPAIRALTVLAVVALVLSLGPYAPGFRVLIRLPGFSFFRAPARWTLILCLALALLAGKGFDSLPTWPRPGRSLLRFLGAAIVAPTLVVIGVELAFASTDGPGWPPVVQALEWSMNQLPWSGDPSFREVLRHARRPQVNDDRVPAGLTREGFPMSSASDRNLAHQRFSIYWHEWRETALLLVLLVATLPLTRRRRLWPAALIAITALDLLMLGRHRPIDLAPIQPLTVQSAVLARFASEPRGSRTIDDLRNLPMIAGSAPVAAYRTLDLPSLESLARLASSRTDPDAPWSAAMRASGSAWQLIGPSPRNAPPPAEPSETIDDPELAAWLLGRPWFESMDHPPRVFHLRQGPPEPARAWFLPIEAAEGLNHDPSDLAGVLQVMDLARPIKVNSPVPERVNVSANVSRAGFIILSQLDYPEWRATLTGPDGPRTVPIRRVFGRPGGGAWQGVEIPAPGLWTLRLDFDGRDVRQGLMVSALAWTLAILVFAWPVRPQSGRMT
ncbi:MAG: hypothetical protein ABI353_11975 [Isosphaeraceae bacterium]